MTGRNGSIVRVRSWPDPCGGGQHNNVVSGFGKVGSDSWKVGLPIQVARQSSIGHAVLVGHLGEGRFIAARIWSR